MKYYDYVNTQTLPPSAPAFKVLWYSPIHHLHHLSATSSSCKILDFSHKRIYIIENLYRGDGDFELARKFVTRKVYGSYFPSKLNKNGERRYGWKTLPLFVTFVLPERYRLLPDSTATDKDRTKKKKTDNPKGQYGMGLFGGFFFPPCLFLVNSRI